MANVRDSRAVHEAMQRLSASQGSEKDFCARVGVRLSVGESRSRRTHPGSPRI